METVLVIKKEDYENIPYFKGMEEFGWIWKEENSFLHKDCYIIHVTKEGEEILNSNN